jgi:hypothetical protein
MCPQKKKDLFEDSCQRYAASREQLLSESLGISEQSHIYSFNHSHPLRTNSQNSDSESDEQMSFISKQSNTFDFSLSDSISRFSLRFPGVSVGIGRECEQFHWHNFDRT